MIEKLIIAAVLVALNVPSAMGREVKAFTDGWQFKKGPFSTETVTAINQWNGKWTDVNIPHTWNTTDMQSAFNNFYEGEAYYRKSFSVPESYRGKRMFLRFEGVGSCADVWLNGKLVASHKGAYSAFVAELTGALKFDAENQLIVKANNKARPDVIPVNHVLFGVYGGIYRPVWLIVTEPVNIAVGDHASPGVYITQNNVTAASAQVKVKVKLDNGSLKPANVTLENVIFTQEGKQVAKQVQNIDLSPQGTQSYVSDFKINKPHLWQGRQDPYLYKVVTRMKSGDTLIDEQVQPLGLRRFEAVAGKGFFLNGKKYPMYGVTRHQDHWGKGSALSNADHDLDLSYIMEMGATTVRFAHYQQSDYLYSRCDSLGLVIWCEIPFVNRVTGKEWENAHSQLRELIRQNFNHPSIYVWGLHNEVYNPTDYCAQLTASLHDLAKTEDPDRMTASVNGYGIAQHPVNQNADIQGMNRYFGWYERKIKDIDPWIEALEKDYPWQKFMLTEYGADANIYHQTEDLGESLNWTKQFYPETFQTKTHEYQWATIAKHPYIIASYLWNSFDFAAPMANRGDVPGRNMKGLMTFDRKIKKDSFYWYKANWSSEPVLYLTQRRNTDREHRITSVTVYSNVGEPTVTLNGTPLTGIRKGYTDVHYVFDKATLAEGKNVLKATVTSGGETYTDEIVWNYSGEKSRATEAYENKNQHVGL
ncbi:MAG: glycoside hydrolase family 2 protein [Muribaculaceae bacterium]